MNKLFLSAVLMTSVAVVSANEIVKDSVIASTTGTKENTKAEVALLNASSASEPRAVPIGLPAAYTVVRQDGLPVTYFWDPNATNLHWRQEGSLQRTTTLPMSMTAILEGEIGVGVDSYSKLGDEKLKGNAKYELNSLGKHNFDIGVSGKVAKNWYFALSAFNTLDPGNVKLQFTPYADRTSFYTGTLTHKYNPNGSKFSFFYRHTNVHNLMSTIKQSPYYWVGDGTIKAIDGFTVGKDNYGSSDGLITYIDVKTGETKTGNYYDLGHAYSHEGKFMLDHIFDNNMKFLLRAKFSYSNRNAIEDNTQNILFNQTRQYADGDGTYTGDVQRRLVKIQDAKIKDYMLVAQLQHKTGNHNWSVGIFDYLEQTEMAGSSTQYEHEVAANPRKLLFNGNKFFNNNASAEYVDGWENKVGAFAMDTWQVHDYIKFTYGGRLEYFYLNANSSMDSRYNGFYIGGETKDGSGTVGLTNSKLKGLNYSFSFIPTINFTKDFGFDGEINFISMYRHLQGFYGANPPLSNTRPHTLARAGLFYNNPYFSVVSSFTYSFRKGDSGRITVTSDNPEEGSVMVPYEQAIQTMGWKTDLLLTPVKNFALNVIFTLQDPKLHKYAFSAFGKDYDFSGKQMNGLSKILLEINPRYTYKNFSIWASARYNSKKYANVGNSIYFNGYWETFAGASWKAFKNVTFTANVVNVLNETGPSGTVPGSALITDGSQYAGTLIAGTYIRPFQAQFGVNINF